MRILVTFTATQPVRLPIAYNHLVQGMIYRHLPEEMAGFLHGNGFSAESRSFKLFSFSRFQGKVSVNQGFITLTPPFSLVITSCWGEFLHGLADGLQEDGGVTFGPARVALDSIMIEDDQPFDRGAATIRMLSPMTTYSTLTGPDGARKTYYYSPFEKDFSQMLRVNLINKYEAVCGAPPVDDSFVISPLKVTRQDEKIIQYKGFIIKGWLGSYRMQGAPALLKLAYDAGLGGKNSQGFGCFEVI